MNTSIDDHSSLSDSLPTSVRALEGIDVRKALGLILAVSVAALLFLVWLIYFKAPAAAEVAWVSNLSAVNAALNSLSTVFLLLGFREIRARNYAKHMRFMISAFVTSALFLVSYIVYHHFVGDTPFKGQGFIRPVYFWEFSLYKILIFFVLS